MFGLHIADISCLIIYLLGITVIGVWAARLIHTMGDFFMPRRFGKAMMTMHGFGTGTHSDQAVGVASKTFTDGLSGIWYQWLWLFATPFYWLIAPVMRRLRALTTGDVFEARYSRSVAMLFAIVGMFQLMVNIGTMLKGSSAVVAASSGGRVSPEVAIGVMTILFVTYGIAGGLPAAIITDFIQGILTVVFSFLLLPFILHAVGGMEGMRDAITDAGMFSLVAPKAIGLFYIVMIAINALVGIVAQPHTMGNCAAGRTEMDGRFGWMTGNFIKRICTIAWCLTGLAAVAYFDRVNLKPEHPDQVFGLVAADFLPRVLPGILGIFLASLLASVMSSCDSFMIASSGLFTENIYKPLVTNRPERHYIFVGRITSLLIVAGGVTFAFLLKGVVEGLETFWKVAAPMGIVFWLGLFWRRTTVSGAWACAVAAFAVWWLTTRSFFVSFIGNLPISDSLRFVWQGDKGPEVYLPWQMVFYLTAGLLAGIVVSLFTRPVSQEKLDDFYALTRTPVTPGEEVLAPCTLPKDAVVPPPRKLIPKSSLEISIPSRTSIIGFLIGCVCVVAIIAIFIVISRA